MLVTAVSQAARASFRRAAAAAAWPGAGVAVCSQAVISSSCAAYSVLIRSSHRCVQYVSWPRFASPARTKYRLI